jgi:hypothetical protein
VSSSRLAVWLSLLVLALAALACGMGPQAKSVPKVTATTSPATAAPQASQSKSILPTTRPSLTAQPKSAATPGAQAAATGVAAATSIAVATPVAPAKAAQSSPTPDPKRIVIAEEDIIQALAGGVGEEQGLKIEGLQVRFADEKISLTADEFSMGPLQVHKLAIVGQLFASDGKLQFEAESLSPGGLMTAMLPTVANQVLAKLATDWYVEDVRVGNGQLELRIR